MGIWKGLVWPQFVKDTPDEVPVEVSFDTRNKVIVGKMSFYSWKKERGKITNVMTGGFQNENDLRFYYQKEPAGILGWGDLLLELSPDARAIKGRINGVSSHTGKHFNSEILLLKGKNANLKEFSRIKNPVIFIGHGGNESWKALKKYLNNKGYKVETFESGVRAGKLINHVLDGMMAGTSIAFLIMTGENKMRDGTVFARQNVVHEIGLCQGKFGSERAVVLLEEGVTDFTNISGISYILFKKGKINTTFREVLATIQREFPQTE